MSKKVYLNESELAERWSIEKNTLAQWRMQKRGISYVKIEGNVRYDLDDVVEYEAKNKVVNK